MKNKKTQETTGKKKTIQILYGLPASGKTTYAEKATRQAHSYSSREAIAVDLDSVFKKAKGDSEKFESYFVKEIKKICSEVNYVSSINTIIIDGLITTNSEAEKAIEIVKNNLPKEWDAFFEIVYWEENREACLWNDRGRRAKNSTNTIKNKDLEIPNIKETGADKITTKLVVRKPEYLIFFQNLKDMFGLQEDKNRDKYRSSYMDSKYPDEPVGFVSSTWSLGGEYGNCWNDKMHRVPPDTEVPVFETFDSILEKVYPECSFLKYKKLYANCVSIRDYFESDYYGGGTTHAYYFCDVQKLYESMIEMKMIDSPDVEFKSE